ncbi:MAG: penicillin-binding transpeptidase domain-containing protein [Flavipsychrobacter sp.]
MLIDQTHEAIHYYNKAQCTQRYLPASTFKIFNSLVALETDVAPDDEMVIKWDSVVRWNPEWNRDMNMREAFKLSNVGYYQEIARRIGAQRMQHYLDTVKYGNMKMGNKIDEFWLDTSLQISADEQVNLMKKLYFNELPFSERTQRIVRSMMLQEDSSNYKLYYKTGTGQQGDKMVYWIVGFIERIQYVHENKNAMNKTNVRMYPYFFAQNFNLPLSDTTKNWMTVRKKILHQVLSDYGAIPSAADAAKQ